ncbi:MAG: metal-sulfur cluster assembly factor [Bacteroidetes bacterium]|nr:metal-sulfur cluster assembly factor [Bacteroidota bacterium]
MSVITNDQLQSDRALAALSKVNDPEIGLDIVNLGLIYQLNFDRVPRKLNCTMTLTTQFCPMGEAITDGAHQALQASLPDHEIVITLTFEPPWNQDMISPEGRVFLNR